VAVSAPLAPRNSGKTVTFSFKFFLLFLSDYCHALRLSSESLTIRSPHQTASLTMHSTWSGSIMHPDPKIIARWRRRGICVLMWL
jgi:hypothetical protein